jgi:hypothetical protein
MKNRVIIKMLSLFILVWIFSVTSATAQSQPPPAPDTHGGANNVPGGGAPIGGGLTLLLAMGAAYGAKKVYQFKNKQLN